MIFRIGFDEATFKGYVDLDLPNYIDKMNLLKEINVKLNKDGEVVVEQDTFTNIVAMKEEVYKRTSAVEIMYEGEKLVTLEEIEYYSIFTEILNHLIEVLFGGAKLGNVKRKA